jgi:uncharacterized protein YjbI with pentapeptide repeats
MADEVILRLLQQGVPAWNQWLDAHPLAWLDLAGADLARAKLAGVDFTGANLVDAVLTRADLTGATLTGAVLTGAILTGTDLSRADLTGAYLNRADLTGAVLADANITRADLNGARLAGADLGGAKLIRADLTRADLTGANLTGANLSRADLTRANLIRTNLSGAEFTMTRAGWTIFGAVDLGTVAGLDTVEHDGPSTIGIDTIYESAGKIPAAFLRGAGAPDDFIAYLDSLAGRVTDSYSCFICYSSQDQEFAERMYADLQARNVRCWLAPEGMEIGQKYRRGIDEGMLPYGNLLLVLSKSSVESTWVGEEVEFAFEQEKKRNRPLLFPLRLDDAVMQIDMAWAAGIRRRHIADFREWKAHDNYHRGLTRLLREIKGSE